MSNDASTEAKDSNRQQMPGMSIEDYLVEVTARLIRIEQYAIRFRKSEMAADARQAVIDLLDERIELVRVAASKDPHPDEAIGALLLRAIAREQDL